MKVRALIRLSKDELLSHSPETQRNLHLEHAKRNGIPESDIVWYEDIGVSGYSEGDETKRGRFSDMLKEAQPGDEVWAVSSDRFARDIEVAQKTVRDLQANGVRVVFFDLPLDFSSRTQRTTAGFKQLSDQLYRDVISEKTTSAVPTVRAKGIRWGRFPDFFEVVIENGKHVLQPSRLARDILQAAASERVGPAETARRFKISRMKVYRLQKAYKRWFVTRPWYASEKYDERREEYRRLKEVRRRKTYEPPQ